MTKEPQSFEEVLSLLLPPLEQEARMGCVNAAVFGGTDTFQSSWILRAKEFAPDERTARQLDDVRAMFADYGVLSVDHRRRRLERARDILGRMLTPPATEAAVATLAAPVEEAEPAAKLPQLQQPVVRISGVGRAMAEHLQRLGLQTIEDMMWHLPRRHEDRRQLRKIAQLQVGEQATVRGKIISVTVVAPRANLHMVKARLSDGSGFLDLVWFNRRYLRSALKKDKEILACGKVERFKNVLQMNSPEYEEMEGEAGLHVGRIVPVYSLTENLTQRAMRKIMWSVVERHADQMHEVLPLSVRNAQELMERARAFRETHFPSSTEVRDAALERLIFEELFVMQVGLALRRRETERLPRRTHYNLDESTIAEFESGLGFSLTSAQRRVLEEIQRDLSLRAPMSRLVQGDVGSGKTVVAAFVAWVACRAGNQAAIMAPTEILAEQLCRKVQSLVGSRFSVRLLKGGMSAREKEDLTTSLALGEVDVAVGTHALIQEGVRFARLSVAIIDEQHKFGVVQRAQLRAKGYNPDVLVMTATPIPRTLALTVYGDLDTSVIDELPPGRSPIKCWWGRGEQADKAYQFVRRQVAEGRQAYIVCPLIEESDKVEAAAAVAEAERLATAVFPDLTVGLLHGRMKADEKDRVMSGFREGRYQILVSTTVVEVGVDIPNATVMVIQNADRFGLAQLHQLRGRVGRGSLQSYCIFLADPASEEGAARMRTIAGTTDGFQIAEEDLKYRGPGDFYGSRQSGLPDLRVADLVRDRKLLERARRAAAELITRDPTLSTQECGQLRNQVLRTFRGQLAQLLS